MHLLKNARECFDLVLLILKETFDAGGVTVSPKISCDVSDSIYSPSGQWDSHVVKRRPTKLLILYSFIYAPLKNQ
jgi:hypothetical protein